MTTTADLFDLDDFARAIEEGYVRRQVHPDLPLAIFNYAEKCVFERRWDAVTRQCRGLITDLSGNVLARPLKKFMNADEPGAYQPRLDEPVIVTEKMDGSLAIGFPVPDDGYAIATRGSFASEQAQHATALWQERYADTVSVPKEITPLWEIIFPANRIVVDYGDLDDLVLLGAVDIATGRTFSPDHAASVIRWPGPVTETFPYETVAEAMASEPRPNREGFVLHFPASDERTKWKYEEYVRNHRLITGMNERVVWEHLGEGGPIDDLVLPLPEEFHEWVRGVAARLHAEQERIASMAIAAHDELISTLPEAWTRKDYALRAAEHAELRAYLFNILDGRDPRTAIWRTLRPSGAASMTGHSEDAA